MLLAELTDEVVVEAMVHLSDESDDGTHHCERRESGAARNQLRR